MAKRLKLSSYVLMMLKDWQKLTFENKERPTKDDRIVWLCSNKAYNDFNLKVLTRWDETRFKREFLNDKHISEWLEFYFA